MAKLAELLLRRKELNDKVEQLKAITVDQVMCAVFERKSVNDTVDEIVAQVPRVSTGQLTAAYDSYASKLRKVDAAIQQANWTTEVEVDASVFQPFDEPESLQNDDVPIRKGRLS